MDSLCAACGNPLAAGDRFCKVCGRAVPGAVMAPIGTPLTPSAPAETSGKAIASLVCGLLFFIPLIFIGAIVLGHLALSEIRRSAGRLKGEGIAIAGLVLGYMWVVSVPIVLIIAAIAIPNLLRARMAANESSAVASVRTLVAAETSYFETHREHGYTCSLVDLRHDQLIDSGMESGQKNGYNFELVGCSGETEGAVNVHFRVLAFPATPNTSGVRAFCSDESGVVKVDSGGSAQACMENGRVL